MSSFEFKHDDQHVLDPNDALVVIAALVYQMGGTFTLCREAIMEIVDGDVPYVIRIDDIEGDKIIKISRKESEG